MTPDARDQVPKSDLAALFRRESEGLVRYFVRRLPEVADAADLLGDVMLVACRRPSAVPREADEARMWLFGVARNVLRSHRRARRRRLQTSEDLRDQLRTSLPDSSPADVVSDALASLTERDQEILRLVHWEGFSQEEAGSVLRIPASTARSRYTRARNRLRVLLERGNL